MNIVVIYTYIGYIINCNSIIVMTMYDLNTDYSMYRWTIALISSMHMNLFTVAAIRVIIYMAKH